MFPPSNDLNRRRFLNHSGGFLANMALAITTAPSVAEPVEMRPLDLGEIVKQCYAAYGLLDVEKVLAFYAEDCLFEDHTFQLSLKGKKELRAMFERNRPLIKELNLDITNIIVSRNWVVTQQVQTGSALNPQAATAGFKSYTTKGASILRFANGKIKHQTDYYDVVSFRKQLGINN